MPEEILITRVVSKTQSKYKIIPSNTKQQSSYNLDMDTEAKLKELNVITPSDTSHFKINDAYKLELKQNLINLIGEKFNSENLSLIFIHTVSEDGTTKFQIKRKDNCDKNTIWFQKLYDNNCEGSLFIISLDVDNKIIYFDIELPQQTFDYKLVKGIDMSIEDEDSYNKKYHKESFNSGDIYLNSTYTNETLQKIFYGVPGTGKSKGMSDIIIKSYSSYLTEGSPFVFRVTIHPEYTYYDFIGNIMPCVKKEDNKSIITYDFIPGPFTLALQKALENHDSPIYLALEEMTRGNIAAIFGDLFQLLDRKDFISEYGIYNGLISNYLFNRSDIEIKIPKNLNILGTVNTSDQNVFIMDNAFKRRFDFEYVSTHALNNLNIFYFKLDEKRIEWNNFYTMFNIFVVEKMRLPEDKQIGQFYINFDVNIPDENKYNMFCNKILNYIWFDIHSNAYDMQSIINPDIKSFQTALEKLKNHENIFSSEFFDNL